MSSSSPSYSPWRRSMRRRQAISEFQVIGCALKAIVPEARGHWGLLSSTLDAGVRGGSCVIFELVFSTSGWSEERAMVAQVAVLCRG